MSVFLSDISERENPSGAADHTCALTHPILGEVDPQRVVKLIQEFDKLLSL